MGEHKRRGPIIETIDDTLNAADYLSTGGEIALNGRRTMSDLVQAGSSGPASTVMQYGSAITAPFAVANGLSEIIDGANEFSDGDKGKGSVSMLGGAGNVASGGLSIAGLLGSGAAGAYAPVAGAFTTGVKGGQYANEDVKERGWLHDREGENASISEWAAENGQAADEWVTDRMGGTLGTVAGLGVTGLSSIAGAGIALGSLGLSALEAGDMSAMMEKAAAEQNGPSRDSQLIDQFKKGAGLPTDAMSAFQYGVNGGHAGAAKTRAASSTAAGMASGMMMSGVPGGAQAKQPKR